ncbi:hypothetical protein HDU93_004612, partial [Gonapodya sp. JEL0774]
RNLKKAQTDDELSYSKPSSGLPHSMDLGSHVVNDGQVLSMNGCNDNELYGIAKTLDGQAVSVQMIRGKCRVLSTSFFRKNWVRQTICYFPSLGLIVFEGNSESKMPPETFHLAPGGTVDLVEISTGTGSVDRKSKLPAFSLTFPKNEKQSRTVKVMRFENAETAKAWRALATGNGAVKRSGTTLEIPHTINRLGDDQMKAKSSTAQEPAQPKVMMSTADLGQGRDNSDVKK